MYLENYPHSEHAEEFRLKKDELTFRDEGFLNNPYRSVRFVDPVSASGYSYEPELYPSTRTTNAVGVSARYFLPYRAALHGAYRFFTDTWGIDSHTLSIGYVHPWGDWTFKAKYRWHDQTGANFYRDIFSRSEATNFRGRDKELSSLTSNTFEFGVSYAFLKNGWNFVEKGSVNLSVNLMEVDYDEFSDLRTTAVLGEEPLYSLKANIIQLFVSFWY